MAERLPAGHRPAIGHLPFDGQMISDFIA